MEHQEGHTAKAMVASTPFGVRLTIGCHEDCDKCHEFGRSDWHVSIDLPPKSAKLFALRLVEATLNVGVATDNAIDSLLKPGAL